MADIDRLIRALIEALDSPTEEAVARCLGMARAMRAEVAPHLAALEAGQQHDGPQLAHVRCLGGIVGNKHAKQD